MEITPADNEKLLYKLVIQFLIFSRGSHKLLEPHLLQIGQQLRNGANLNQLTPELHAVSKTLLHISKQSTQDIHPEKKQDENAHQYDYLIKRLDEILSEVNVPQRFQYQTSVLRQKSRAEFNQQSYKKFIDSAITLLMDIHGYAESENLGLDEFLGGITQELNQIEKHAEIAGQASRLTMEKLDKLNVAMHRQVDTIKDAAERAEEITVLKDHTRIHLDRLLLQLIEHQQQEDERQLQAQEQIEMMSRKLQDLEAETESLRTKLKIEHDKALCDSLTGLPNRLAYNARADLEFSRWKRYKLPLTLCVWDIDHFKRINDTYGHKAGDKTLALVGQLLANNCRETDFVARYGGEEFVMLLPNTSEDQGLEMAEKVRKLIQNCGFNFNGEDIKLTLCCGIRDFKEGDKLENVFDYADHALYQCKQSGRNRCAVYNGG